MALHCVLSFYVLQFHLKELVKKDSGVVFPYVRMTYCFKKRGGFEQCMGRWPRILLAPCLSTYPLPTLSVETHSCPFPRELSLLKQEPFCPGHHESPLPPPPHTLGQLAQEGPWSQSGTVLVRQFVLQSFPREGETEAGPQQRQKTATMSHLNKSCLLRLCFQGT